MDPLSALALAAAVVQFIDFGWKVAKRVDEYSSHNPQDTPKSLQAVCTQLPLLLSSLGHMKSGAQVDGIDVNTRCILRGVVAGCMAQVEALEAIVDEIARVPGESLRVRMKKVFVSLEKDKAIAEIQHNLQTYISVLVLHHVVDAADAAPELPNETYYFDVRERPVEAFVDRSKVMKQLQDALRPAANSLAPTPTIVHLSGERGAGKTQLALAFAHAAQAQGQFRTAFWRDASSTENLCMGLESVAAVVRRSADGSRQEKLDFVQAFLADLWHPWLLVFDNYDPREVDGIMSFLPHRGSGAIILISEAAPRTKDVVQVPKFHSPREQSELNQLLAAAVQRKDEEGIKDLLNQGADVDTLIWDEWPVLHRAALFGLEDTVQLLLERGASLSPPANVAKPLYWAANGQASIVAVLLDHEDATSSFGKPADYDAAFGQAAAGGHIEIVGMLLKRRNIRVNCEVKYGQTALQLAAKEGHTDMVELLIRYGALQERHAQANEALIDAASGGKLAMVKILLGKGMADVNAQKEDGRTALCNAAALRDENGPSGKEMTQCLLDAGADPNICSRDSSPLQEAALRDHTSIVELLLARGADPACSAGGWDPLSAAIKYKSLAAARILLGAPFTDDAAGRSFHTTALWVACRSGERDLVLQVLDAGAADLEATDGTGQAPLSIAIAYGHVPTARLLIRRGARHDVPDSDGDLPLHKAASAGYDLLVRDLLREGAVPDVKNGKGETAMCLAAKAGNEKVIKELLDGGASPNAENKYGETPLDLAEEANKKDVVKLLEDLAGK